MSNPQHQQTLSTPQNLAPQSQASVNKPASIASMSDEQFAAMCVAVTQAKLKMAINARKKRAQDDRLNLAASAMREAPVVDLNVADSGLLSDAELYSLITPPSRMATGKAGHYFPCSSKATSTAPVDDMNDVEVGGVRNDPDDVDSRWFF